MNKLAYSIILSLGCMASYTAEARTLEPNFNEPCENDFVTLNTTLSLFKKNTGLAYFCVIRDKPKEVAGSMFPGSCTVISDGPYQIKIPMSDQYTASKPYQDYIQELGNICKSTGETAGIIARPYAPTAQRPQLHAYKCDLNGNKESCTEVK